MFGVGLADGIGAALAQLETTCRRVDDISGRGSNVVIVELRHHRMNVKLIDVLLEFSRGMGAQVVSLWLVL